MASALRRGFFRAYELLKRLNRFLVWVAAIGIVAINLLTIVHVVTRYILRDPATWTLPLSSFLLLYVIYLSTAYTLERGGHVGMEFVVEMLPARWRVRCLRLASLLGLVFVLLFFWESFRLAQRAIVEGERDISVLSVPLALTTIILPVGLGLMALTYLAMIIDGLLRPGLGRGAVPEPVDRIE